MSEVIRFLVFQAGGLSYALPFEQVIEVAEVRPLSPVPRTPAWCLGATRSHGAVVAVVDFAAFSGHGAESHPQKLVVLNLPAGGLALQVGQVSAVLFEPPVMREEDDLGSWLLTREGRTRLLDAGSLLRQVAGAIAR